MKSKIVYLLWDFCGCERVLIGVFSSMKSANAARSGSMIIEPFPVQS